MENSMSWHVKRNEEAMKAQKQNNIASQPNAIKYQLSHFSRPLSRHYSSAAVSVFPVGQRPADSR